MVSQIAFLGIGQMGEGITENLVKKGNLQKPLILWNRTTARATEHAAKIGNSIAAETLKDTLAADLIWTCLTEETAVNATIDELLSHDVKGKLFVDSSTISPQITNEVAARVIGAGAEFVALPVFGDPSMAKIAVLTAIPAGKPESVEKVLPYLTGVIGKATVNLAGEEPGQASLLKFIGNVMIVTTAETAAEMHVFAEKTGLGPSNIQKLFEALLPGSPHALYTKYMLSGQYHKGAAGPPVEHGLHLANRVLSVAKSTGVSLKSYEVGVQHMEKAKEHAGEHSSIFGIYGAVRQEAGLPFEN